MFMLLLCIELNRIFWICVAFFAVTCINEWLHHDIMSSYLLGDAAALVLTLCCGARWTSCSSSFRLLLLLSLLLKTSCVQSVLQAHVLHSHFSKVCFSFCPLPLPSRNRVTFPFPCFFLGLPPKALSA